MTTPADADAAIRWRRSRAKALSGLGRHEEAVRYAREALEWAPTEARP